MDSGVGIPLAVWGADDRALPGHIQAITRCFPAEERQFTPGSLSRGPSFVRPVR